MPYKQGDIVLVPFPFTDLSGTKSRPAIVVSNRLVNNSDDIILAEITTQPISGPLGLKISNADVSIPFKPPHNSMNVYCKKITILHKKLIKKRITRLSSTEKLDEMLGIISSMFTSEN